MTAIAARVGRSCGSSCLCGCCGCLCCGSNGTASLVGVNLDGINGKLVTVNPPNAELQLTVVRRLNDGCSCRIHFPSNGAALTIDGLRHILGLGPVIWCYRCGRTKCTLPLADLITVSRKIDFNLLYGFACANAQVRPVPADHSVTCWQLAVSNLLVQLLFMCATAASAVVGGNCCGLGCYSRSRCSSGNSAASALIGYNRNGINGKFITIDPPNTKLQLTVVRRLNDGCGCRIYFPSNGAACTINGLRHILGLGPVIWRYRCGGTECALPLANLIIVSRNIDQNFLYSLACANAQVGPVPADHLIVCRQFAVSNLLVQIGGITSGSIAAVCCYSRSRSCSRSCCCRCFCCKSCSLCCGCGSNCSCSGNNRICTSYTRNAAFQAACSVYIIQCCCCTNQCCIVVNCNFVRVVIGNAVIISREI